MEVCLSGRWRSQTYVLLCSSNSSLDKKCPEEPPLSMSVYVDSEKSVFSQLLNKLGVGAACLPWDLGGVVLVFFKAVHKSTGSAKTTPSLSIKDCCHGAAALP